MTATSSWIASKLSLSKAFNSSIASTAASSYPCRLKEINSRAGRIYHVNAWVGGCYHCTTVTGISTNDSAASTGMTFFKKNRTLLVFDSVFSAFFKSSGNKWPSSSPGRALHPHCTGQARFISTLGQHVWQIEAVEGLCLECAETQVDILIHGPSVSSQW